jgi:hypothetical protein
LAPPNIKRNGENQEENWKLLHIFSMFNKCPRDTVKHDH